MITKNKVLSIIAVCMFQLAVISFLFGSSETNFNLEENVVHPDTHVLQISKNVGNITDELVVAEESEPTVRVKVGSSIEVLPLEKYIVGVVAGEMPASFDIEALKAQAVASRTYALYRKQANAGKSYDLTNTIDTQVYISEDDMHKKWGNEFEKYYNRVANAVDATKNQVITYNDKIIEAFYFAMSSGNTQESGMVFNENRDYLKGVISEYENASLKGYNVSSEFSKEEFIKRCGVSCSNVKIDNVEKNEAGYVKSITICGKTMSSSSFRTKFNLRSTNFDVVVGDKVKITTRGFGHGVGMSQYGANGYANAGYSYEDIIKHYYTGVEIKNLKDV